MRPPQPNSTDSSATSSPARDVAAPGETHPMALDVEDLALSSSTAPTSPAESYGHAAFPAADPFTAPELWGLLDTWRAALRMPARVFAAGFLFYLFTFNFSVVRGSSMAPGIHDGDRILIDQFSYLFMEIDRGDIVVLQYPLDPTVDYIKRVVGLPGDEIVMAEGRLWINGELQSETYTLEDDPFTDLHRVVSDDHYFVLGDNRLHSSDSREFGEVPTRLVRGKVDVRLWPPARAGLLE